MTIKGFVGQSRILKTMRDLTGSQCRSLRAGVMCSFRLVPVISRAEMF